MTDPQLWAVWPSLCARGFACHILSGASVPEDGHRKREIAALYG